MAKSVEELECWRLADRRRTEVVAICAQPHVAKHLKSCDGFTETAGKVCRSISKGFGRFQSSYIVQFFGHAIAGLNEVEDYLRECRTRRFIDTGRFDQAMDLAEHTKAATLKFRRYHERRLQERRHHTQMREIPGLHKPTRESGDDG